MINFRKFGDSVILVTPDMIPSDKTGVRLVFDVRLVTGTGEVIVRHTGLSDFPAALDPHLGQMYRTMLPDSIESGIFIPLKTRIVDYFNNLFAEHKKQAAPGAAQNPKPGNSIPPLFPSGHGQ